LQTFDVSGGLSPLKPDNDPGSPGQCAAREGFGFEATAAVFFSFLRSPVAALSFRPKATLLQGADNITLGTAPEAMNEDSAV